jgi:hypothetical protein
MVAPRAFLDWVNPSTSCFIARLIRILLAPRDTLSSYSGSRPRISATTLVDVWSFLVRRLIASYYEGGGVCNQRRCELQYYAAALQHSNGWLCLPCDFSNCYCQFETVSLWAVDLLLQQYETRKANMAAGLEALAFSISKRYRK